MVENKIRQGLLVAALLLVSVVPSRAERVRVIGGVEVGAFRMGDLANYLGFDPRENAPVAVALRLRDEPMKGFRLGLRPHPSFEVVWSRLHADSRTQVDVGGSALVEDPDAPAPVILPPVSVRIDMITMGFRINRWKVWQFVPTARVGFGWVLLSPDEALRGIPDQPPVAFADSDKALEASVGMTGTWRFLELSGELRSVHWRWDPESDLIPGRTTHAWGATISAGLVF